MDARDSNVVIAFSSTVGFAQSICEEVRKLNDDRRWHFLQTCSGKSVMEISEEVNKFTKPSFYFALEADSMEQLCSVTISQYHMAQSILNHYVVLRCMRKSKLQTNMF
jgi:hypothetical protein